jgi:hypothetical protein
MKTIEVEITGTTSLLQHRFGEQAEVDGAKATRAIAIAEETPRKAAERVCYRDPDGNLYMPGASIARLLREAGGAHKQKGSRRSVKYIVPAAVLVPQDTIPLRNGVPGPLTDFEVDSRPVTIPATKGRIMRHRPRIDDWRLEFTLEVDESVLPVEVVHQLLTEGGRGIGIGDFRPEKGGPFGRFRVTRWAERDSE